MSLDKIEVANLSHEQLKELTALESKLGVALVAYEQSNTNNSN